MATLITVFGLIAIIAIAERWWKDNFKNGGCI